MSTHQIASRVVEIQNLLVSVALTPSTRVQLLDEQRQLWDAKFPGKPFELVVSAATIH